MSGKIPQDSSDLPREKSPDEQIKDKLRSGGLDPSYWFEVFKDELQVNIPEEMECIGEESYKDLVKHIRKEREVKALRKFLHMPIDEQSKPQSEDLDKRLEERLKSVGLDPSYWLVIVKSELKLSIPEELENIGKESYQDLTQHVRKEREKKSLRKLLGMSEDEASSTKSEREKKREKLKRDQEKAEAMLQQLKKLEKEGKNRHESVVKKLEDGIQELLHINPDAWISKDKSLDELTSSLQVYIDKLSGTLKERNNVSDVRVLTSASGGRALRGILKSRRSENHLKIGEKLLKAPNDVQFDFSAKSQDDKTDIFTSKHKEDEFCKTVERLGYSAAVSVEVGYGGFGVESTISYSTNTEDEETTEDHQQEQYSSTVMYSFVPMASFLFEDTQLQLSPGALRYLKAIEHVLNNTTASENNLQNKCEAFFEKYGSHVSKGDIHFGGIYRWKCYSQGFQKSQMVQVKCLQSQVISACVRASYGPWGVGASVGGDWSKLSANITGKYSETLKNQTHLHVTKTGGPQEVSDLPQWKNGLVASNSTWSVIDCGRHDVPLWEIVQMNHRKEFQDPVKLIQALIVAYRRMTNSKVEFMHAEQLFYEEEDSKDLMKTVSTWNKMKDLSMCEEHLQKLLDVKQQLVKESINLRVWADHYLSQDPIQHYLKWVVEVMQDKNASGIKLLMHQLLFPDVNSVTTFPGKLSILKWVDQPDSPSESYDKPIECSSFESLQSFVEQGLHDVNMAIAGSSVLVESAQREVTLNISEAVNSLRTHLQSSHTTYDDLLLVTLLYPLGYDVNQTCFVKPLSTQNLKYLSKELKSQPKHFSRIKSKRSIQAYLFHLALCFLQSNPDLQSQTNCHEHFMYIREVLKTELDPSVKDLLVTHYSNSTYDWQSLQLELEEVICRPQDEPQNYTGVGLLNFLKTVRKVSESENECLEPQHDKPFCPDMREHGEDREAFVNILKKLDILNHYPQKMMRKDAICIRQDSMHSKRFYILEKIMMHNYKYWKCLVEEPTKEEKEAPKDKPSSSYQSDNSDTDSDNQQQAEFVVHPMDSLWALLLCANNLLRQDLMSKMSACKLAVPLLLPDPYTHTVTFPLWAMRSIVKEWKVKGKGEEKASLKECSMVDCQVPIISFLRLSGSEERSKSKILNQVVSDSKHDFFFHWDCEGASVKRVLVEGVVELCWYLPAGKETDHFSNVITFTNLRGDSRNYGTQVKFLSEISFMSFVLLTQKDFDRSSQNVLQNLARAPGGLVLMFPDASESDKVSISKEILPRRKYSKMRLKGKNLATIRKEIRHRITESVENTPQQFTKLTDCKVVAETCGILIDENDVECIAGQRLAEDLLMRIAKLDPIDTVHNQAASERERSLPLQAPEMWHTWVKHNKEKHRPVGIQAVSTSQYNLEMQDKKDAIRRMQLSKTDPPIPVMRSFLSSLLQHKGYTRKYFLQWLKLLLDSRSRQLLPEIQAENKQLKCELQQQSTRQVKEIRQDLKLVSDELVEKSLGLEHLLREVGQLYESVMEVPLEGDHKQRTILKDLQSEISCLPVMAAELLIEGYPLELMDGDAGHVPMTWVTDVIQNVQKHLGEAQLFVLSVLGIQSSGKSTLMNTMFGAQFSVSAGRCTRGAFIQLLKLQQIRNCDYLLIVDTEGLRAPELDSGKMPKHDNELATFVIGLANVTLINIFGETPSDMHDILQTTVHAFIRMKEVRLKPSCKFVHQNVAAISADSKTSEGKVQLVQNLNEMVKLAAKEEHCEGKYTSFKDIMSFDVTKDVYYFPNLWEGDPPMAPVNPGYSEKAQDLKSALVAVVTPKFTVATYKKHVESLWQAVLYENFVFSFKNTLEVTAYNALDSKYGQLSCELQCKILEWEQSAEHEVYSCPLCELDKLEKDLTTRARILVTWIETDLSDKMGLFFEETEHGEILIQWKGQTALRLENLCSQRQSKLEDYCGALIQHRKDRELVDKMEDKMYEKLQQPVRDLAQRLRGTKLDDDGLKKEFNHLWNKLTSDILPTSPAVHQADAKVEYSVENCLKELFRRKGESVLTQELEKCDLRQRGTPLQLKVLDAHVKRKGFFQGVWGYFLGPRKSDKADAQKRTSGFLQLAETYLKGLQMKKFSDVFCYDVLRVVLNAADKMDQEKVEYIFTETYRIDIALTVGGYALKKLEQMIQENAPSSRLEKLKEPFYTNFVSQYHQRSVEEAAAKSLCACLKEPLQDAVISSLVPEVVQEVKCMDDRFKTKQDLLFNILVDLEKKSRFDLYVIYLRNVEESLRYWIKEYTLEHCRRKGRLEQLANLKLYEKVRKISVTAGEVTKSLANCDLHTWLKHFHHQLSNTFSLDLNGMQKLVGGVLYHRSKEGRVSEKFQPDFVFFESLFNDELRAIQQELIGTFKSLPEEMEQWEKIPYDILCKEMGGCFEQCPFCKAKCEKLDPNHPGEHRVAQHRPECLGGYNWEGRETMVLDVCTTSVESNARFRCKDTNHEWHPYKEYRKIYPKWSIEPNSSRYDSSYWKWFVAKYKHEIAKYFGSTVPTERSEDGKLLSDWEKLTWEGENGVLKTLQKSFDIHHTTQV